ncbi:MAG: PIG-L deacetylase family protein [Saccharofermentanales bacterium]
MEIINNFKSENVLFLGAHLDDIEFGCGALIYKLCKYNNKNIFVSVLSTQNKNAKGELQLKRNINESKNSFKLLGIKRENVFLGPISGQVFDTSMQDIREYLLQLKDKVKPSSVFYPGNSDVHQDHSTLSKEAYRIFRNETCIGYEIIRSNFLFSPNIYIKIESDGIKKKSDAILSYSSQYTESAGYYFSKEAILALGKFRGIQIGVDYAEAFECYRLISYI